MLSDLLEKIVSLTQKAYTPTLYRVEGEPASVYHVATLGGVETVHAVPPDRALRINTLEDLVRLANEPINWGDDGGSQAIFYDEREVTLVRDTRGSANRATLALEPTKEWSWVKYRNNTPNVSPAELRYDLRHTMDAAIRTEGLADKVARLGNRKTDDQEYSRTTGRESMGRQIESQIREPEALPDERQVFDVRRYANPDLAYRLPVEFLLEADPSTLQWHCQPREPSLITFEEDALAAVGKYLHDHIKPEQTKVLQGKFLGSDSTTNQQDSAWPD